MIYIVSKRITLNEAYNLRKIHLEGDESEIGEQNKEAKDHDIKHINILEDKFRVKNNLGQLSHKQQIKGKEFQISKPIEVKTEKISKPLFLKTKYIQWDP